MRAVELEEELDAGVDGAVAQPAVLAAPDEDRARPAVPLLAHDLRPRQPLVVAEKAGERLEGLRPADAVRLTVEMEDDRVAHFRGCDCSATLGATSPES